MVKLYDIPIYAISPSKFKKRVWKYILELKERYENLEQDKVTRIIDMQTFPMRSWEYNHIIGFIRVTATKNDIIFDVFLPQPTPKKYIWTTTKKVHVQNMFANGAHIYLGSLRNNKEIREAISNMLSHIIDEYIHERFYVDCEAFDVVNKHLDYMGIMQNI